MMQAENVIVIEQMVTMQFMMMLISLQLVQFQILIYQQPEYVLIHVLV
jgi:hypothetical protein